MGICKDIVICREYMGIMLIVSKGSIAFGIPKLVYTASANTKMGGFPKLGVPIRRILVYWGLYWGRVFRETPKSQASDY